MSIGNTIQTLRAERNLPQRTIADYLNVSVATVSHYELGRHLPDIVTITKLADFYDVSVDYLVGRTTTRKRI